MNYDLTAKCEDGPLGYSTPPLSKRLEDRKERLEAELSKINRAIELMQKTPDLSLLMDTISQLNV